MSVLVIQHDNWNYDFSDIRHLLICLNLIQISKQSDIKSEVN